MRLHLHLVVGFALGMAGCAEKEQAAPGQAAEPQASAPAAEPTPTKEPAADARNDAFLDHMHAHAAHLDDLNFALAEENLVAATVPAYWLSRHDTVSGVPLEWQPYVTGMREAATAVLDSPDLDSARAAAERITVQCQGCHAAAGAIP